MLQLAVVGVVVFVLFHVLRQKFRLQFWCVNLSQFWFLVCLFAGFYFLFRNLTGYVRSKKFDKKTDRKCEIKIPGNILYIENAILYKTQH